MGFLLPVEKGVRQSMKTMTITMPAVAQLAQEAMQKAMLSVLVEMGEATKELGIFADDPYHPRAG